MTRQRSFAPFASLAVLAAGAAAAYAARTVIASERLSDEAGLILSAGTAIGLILGAAIGMRFTLGRKTWRDRASVGASALGLLAVGAVYIDASLVDASVAMESLVESGGPPSPSARLDLGPTGRDIRLTGELGEGVARRLAILLTAHPEVTRIHLTSEGGLADEGRAIGDVVAAHGLTTFVPDYCVSACTLAFVRGRERLMLADARLGFHAPYEQGLFGAMYRGDPREQRAAYLAAGVAPGFVDAALRVDPDDIWYPAIDRLLAANVITVPIDRYSMPDSNLDGMADLDGARSLLLRNFPLLKAFDAASPHAVELIAGWYLDAYRRGRSEGENTDGVKAIVQSAIGAALARSDDATLLDLARFLARGAGASAMPQLCDAIIRRVDLIAATRQLEGVDAAAEPAAEALLRRALAGTHVLATAPGAPRGAAAGVATIAVTGATKSADIASRAASPTRSCADWHRASDDLLGKAPAEIVRVMRALVEAQAIESIATMKAVWRTRN